MINSKTYLLGLIGSPVEHSLSPVVHNHAFAAVGYNGIYLAFKVIDLDSAIKGIKALNLKGVSVTIRIRSTSCNILMKSMMQRQRLGL
jgi:shikimate dehydrogenase